MSKSTAGAARAPQPEVSTGPAGDQSDVQRGEVLQQEAAYAVERLAEKVSKAKERLKDAEAAYAAAQNNAKAADRDLVVARRGERDR